MTTYPDFLLRRINESFNLYEVVENCYVMGRGIIVPEGFATDFASIPRFLWGILPPHGAAMPASVLHDYHYTFHPFSMEVRDMEIERRIADDDFKENLLKANISKFQAGMMYRAVRLFGAYRFKHYGKSRKTVKHEEKIKQNRKEKGL